MKEGWGGGNLLHVDVEWDRSFAGSGPAITIFPQLKSIPSIVYHLMFTSDLCTFPIRISVKDRVERFKNFGDGEAYSNLPEQNGKY